MFEPKVRDVAEQLVLTQRREHLHQTEVPDANRELMARLSKLAADNGGVTGLIFTCFLDPEYNENDINFEVCVPVSGDVDDAEATVRVEPAHREAYVRLKKRETFPPEIGNAYGAVAAWIGEQQLTIVGPAREVYFADFDTAGPDDEVFDVAFPIA